MKFKTTAVLAIFALLVFGSSPPGSSGAFAEMMDKPSHHKEASGKDPQPIDIGPQMRDQANDEQLQQQLQEQLQNQAEKVITKQGKTPGLTTNFTAYEEGIEKYFLGYNTVDPAYYIKPYTLKKIGEHVEVWVANDNTWPEGDERPTPEVTDEQIDQLVAEFDDNIYEKEIEFFGQPDGRTGEHASIVEILREAGLDVPDDYYVPQDGTERVILLIDNVRDENYFDPDYPLYVAGFFSPVYERYFDRNIVNIDTYNLSSDVEGAYGTLAHEFQHLIHSDNDSDEVTWLNEGMSDLAEYIVGYGHPMSHVDFYLNHPENSLVAWDEYADGPNGPETLGDYGQAYLLMLYMLEQYGEEFIQKLARHSSNGIESVDEVLDEVSAGIDFGELFRNFSIALAIDSPGLGGSLFNHKNNNRAIKKFKEHIQSGESLENHLDTPGKIRQLFGSGVKSQQLGSWFDDFSLAVTVNDFGLTGDIYNFDSIDLGVNFGAAAAFDKEGVPAWGTDYIKLDATDDVRNVAFDLMDFQPIPWEIVDDPLDAGHGNVFWGGDGNLIDNQLVIEADLSDVRSPTLAFDHYYNIEEGWDYGVVQVSSDGGETWTSLENEHTRSDVTPDAHPKIKENVPGFTGTNDGWHHETFDLSQYAGEDILITFRYLTDWASNEAGWYVDHVEISEIGFSSDGGSFDDFRSLDEIQGNYVNYQVSFVNKRTFIGGFFTLYKVLNYDPFNVTDDTVKELKRLRTDRGETYMIFWQPARIGERHPADYSYEVNAKQHHDKHPKKGGLRSK